MHPVDHLYALFDEGVKRAKQSYNPKNKKKDKRTARSSSLNNALKSIKPMM